MSKRTQNRNTTPTDTADSGVLSLASLNELDTPQRVDLYVATETKQRLGFLLQGKILFTLGEQGLNLLRAAGIKPGSLYNARRGEWVLRTFTGADKLQNFTLHNGSEATEFTEATYDGLTLLQCELLQKAFTRMGQVPNRPDHTTARQICADADWDDNLECYFENGCTLAEQEQQARDAEAEIAAERERQQQMAAQIAQQEAIIAAQREQLNAAPPPAPVIAFNTPVTQGSADTPVRSDAAPDNVVAFPAVATIEEEPTAEQEDVETGGQGEEETSEDPDTVTIEPESESDDVTPEEIGSAVADAVKGMAEYSENGPVCIDSALSELEDYVGNQIDQCDVGELHGFANRLDTLLTLVRGHIAAKAAPQDELPAAKVKAKRGSKKAEALAA